MTPNHDHETLFVAPAAAPAGKTGSNSPDTSQPTVDETPDAMRRLRHPFATGPAKNS
jgi:hypothetical protein